MIDLDTMPPICADDQFARMPIVLRSGGGGNAWT
jgi:hypothetical protein